MLYEFLNIVQLCYHLFLYVIFNQIMEKIEIAQMEIKAQQQKTVNQLLFEFEKFLQGFREPPCREYLLPWTSICHFSLYKNKCGQEFVGEISREIKSSRIIVGVQ